jgi:hypothetical protein
MKIHLNSRQGLFEVETYGRDTITLSTKHNVFQVPVSDFKSFAGGIWNTHVTKHDMDTFLSVVQPDKYKIQVEQENQILTLAVRLGMIQDAVKAQQSVVVEESDDYQDIPFETDEPTKDEYEKWWRDKCDELNSTRNKMRSIARQVYSQNLDFTHFQNHNGIKFIIQQDHVDENSYRLCWDPYGFVSNGHSDISSIYRDNIWGTINGGWIKIIGDDVILYFKSGDYGVYDDAIATECAKKVFPGKKIHSFAGRQWDDELDSMFESLPF